jgi:AraC-like DNA-binding protein
MAAEERPALKQSHVEIRYALPDPYLFDIIAAYLEITISGEEMVEDLLPPDVASIRIALSGTWMQGRHREEMAAYQSPLMLCGTSSTAHWTRGKGKAFCIGLHPAAWSALVGRRANTLEDQAIPLSDVFGQTSDALFDALMQPNDFEDRVAGANTWLLAHRRHDAEPGTSAVIMAVRLALADPDCATVATLSARAGISQPSLARLCKRHFGDSPKALIRRARFRRMLHRIDARSYDDWRTFIDTQYVDQSHLIRDFKFYLGLSPSQYMALDRPYVAAAFAAFRKMMNAEPDWG